MCHEHRPYKGSEIKLHITTLEERVNPVLRDKISVCMLTQLLAEVKELKEARHAGRMEALNAVFQINGPSRAITRLKEQYAAELAKGYGGGND